MPADAPEFETPAWRQTGALQLRRAGARERLLLLKLSTSETVYRYDAAAASLEELGSIVWEESEAKAADCEVQSAGQRIARIDQDQNVLRVGDRVVQAAGATALNVKVSPGGTMAALLSAEGPRAKSILPFLGRGGASGQHYHELISLPDGERVGKAVALPLGSDRVALTACWDSGEDFVIYTDVLFSRLSVVERRAGKR